MRSVAADRNDLAEIESLNVFSQATGQSLPLKQVADVVVARREGQPVYVRDVAEVHLGYKKPTAVVKTPSVSQKRRSAPQKQPSPNTACSRFSSKGPRIGLPFTWCIVCQVASLSVPESSRNASSSDWR